MSPFGQRRYSVPSANDATVAQTVRSLPVAAADDLAAFLMEVDPPLRKLSTLLEDESAGRITVEDVQAYLSAYDSYTPTGLIFYRRLQACKKRR